MKSKAIELLRALPGLALAVALAAAAAAAQQPTPTPQKSAGAQAQSPGREGGAGGLYTVISSFEVGYRGLRVDGDLNKYQSDLNYKAGPRLFDSSLLVQAKPGAGDLFDSFLVTTSGWGADPTAHTRVHAEKSRWYRFDGNYRRFRYFRYLNNIANPGYQPPSRQVNPVVGLHNFDTRQQVGDFDLTLLPKNDRVSFQIGYSPATNRGPVYQTTRGGGDEFQVLARAHWRSHDFRLGADWKLGPVDFSLMQGFRRFRDDSTVDDEGVNIGMNPTASNVVLTEFARQQPVRGSVDYTRFSGHTLLARKLDVSARFIYTDSETDFSYLEELAGRNFNPRISIGGAQFPAATGNVNTPNTAHLVRYDIRGDAKRPGVVGDLGVTFFATRDLRISNTLRAETFQLSGGSLYNAFFDMTLNSTGVRRQLSTAGYSYENIKYRRVQNTLEADYTFTERYSASVGYRHGRRRVEEVIDGYNLASNLPTRLTPSRHEEENQTNVVFGGFRARPVKAWSLNLSVEHGTADHVFTRTGGQYDYTNVRARSRYTPTRDLSLSFAVVTRNNSLPPEIEGVSLTDFGADIRSRTFTTSVDWTAHSNLSFSGGYNYNWAESDAFIRYAFAVPPATTTNGAIRGRSQYFARTHFFHVETTARPLSRVTLYAAYRVNKDTGQGDRVADPLNGLLITSYPMSFQSPEARVAFRVNRRMDWNLGYQYYNYNESDLLRTGLTVRPQNYHAHLPYASLRFYFGNADR